MGEERGRGVGRGVEAGTPQYRFCAEALTRELLRELKLPGFGCVANPAARAPDPSCC